ncbi:MAG: hypothetical protein ACYTBJ_18830 [Planctomycetota bacterium]|jgi:hypothetical protein
MRKIVTHLIRCAFLTCLCSSAAVALDDFDDGDHDRAWFIANGGKTYPLRRLDSDGKYQESIVYSITVNSNYKPNHARDNDGTNYPHVDRGRRLLGLYVPGG